MLAVLERLASRGRDPKEGRVFRRVPVVELGALDVPAKSGLAHGHDDLAAGAIISAVDGVVVGAVLNDVQALHGYILLLFDRVGRASALPCVD